MALTDYYNKQGPSVVLPSWHPSLLPPDDQPATPTAVKQEPSVVMPPWHPSLLPSADQTATSASVNGSATPPSVNGSAANPAPKLKKDVFGATIKSHDNVDLAGSTSPTPTPPASPSPASSAAAPATSDSSASAQPAVPLPQPQGVIDYAAKMKGAESRANALNDQTDAARTAMTAAQNQQVAAYDAVPFRATGFYETLFKQLNPYKPKTAAEIQRDLKRERNNKMIAAIGDGISALANLWGTSQGALNAYDGKQTMSQRYADMYDKLRAERKANDEKYLAQYMSALGMDDANANARRNNAIARGGVLAQNARLTYTDLLSAAAREQARADQFGQQWQTQTNFTTDFTEKQRQFNENFAENQRQFDKNYEETVRAHKASEALQAQSNSIHASSVALQREQYRESLKQGQIPLQLNADGDILNLSPNHLSSGTIDKALQHVEKDLHGTALFDYTRKVSELKRGDAVTNTGGLVVGYKEKPLTAEDRFILLQDFIGNSESAQNYMRNVVTGRKNTSSSSSGSHKSNPYG